MHKTHHAFLELNSQEYTTKDNKKQKVKQIWPILMNKAAAKMYGGYREMTKMNTVAIVSAFTNGIPQMCLLDDPIYKQELYTGVFWSKLKYWCKSEFIMGAESPNSDKDFSHLGIIQNYTYRNMI